MAYKTFTTQIFPTEAQKAYIHEMIHIRRWLWNKTHELYQNCDSKFLLNKNLITKLVNKIEIPFEHTKIAERLRRSVAIRYVEAWRNFFRKIGGRPHFHSKKTYNTSVEFIDVDAINLRLYGFGRGKKGEIRLAEKVPSFKRIFNISYSVKNNKYYVCACMEVEDEFYKSSSGEIGLDYGIKNFFTDDKGNIYNMPNRVLKISQRINKLQRVLSKKQKDSHNFEKVRIKLNIAYTRRANIQKDYVEKLTLQLLRENKLIGLETLNMMDMRKESYRKARNRMSINCFGIFRETLKNKNKKFPECSVIFVDKHYPSSQICSLCGKKHKLKLSERFYKCECGNKLDRDINAARNILVESRRLWVNSR